MNNKGRIVKEWIFYIECALCEQGDSMAPMCYKTDAEKKARALGWSKTSKHGWVCRDCKEGIKHGV